MSMDTICEFLGWCTVINFGFLFLGGMKVWSMRNWASKVHAAMFDIDAAYVRRSYFQFFAVYKVAIIVFNLVPYVALRVMASL